MTITAAQQKQGRLAEKQIKTILSGLPKDRYAVYNDIQVRYGNIDHLVVSKDGIVFLIETKSHKGKVSFCNGQLLLNDQPFKKDIVGQVISNIRWIRSKVKSAIGMNLWVVAIIVFTNAVVCSSGNHPALKIQPVHRINMLNKNYLKNLIESYSPKSPQPYIWNRRAYLLDALSNSE